MKKILIVLSSFGLGYALNTESGKKLRAWAYTKVQDQVNNLVGKIDEVTEETPDSPDPEKK